MMQIHPASIDIVITIEHIMHKNTVPDVIFEKKIRFSDNVRE